MNVAIPEGRPDVERSVFGPPARSNEFPGRGENLVLQAAETLPLKGTCPCYGLRRCRHRRGWQIKSWSMGSASSMHSASKEVN